MKINNIGLLAKSYYHLFLLFCALTLILNIAVSAQEVEASVPVALLPVSGDGQLTPEKVINSPLPETQQGQQASPNNKVAANTITELSSTQWSGYAAVESLAINGDPQGALKQLDARLVAQPNDAKASYIKGMILMQLGRIDDAERWFNMMQSNFPELPQSYNALAVIYAAKNDLYKAELTLRELLDKHPNQQKARLNLANIYLDLAEIELKNALKETPNDAMISNTLQSLQRLRD